MRRRGTLTALCATLAAALTLWASPMQAHLMPAQSGTLNVRDRAVFGALSIPVSALTGFDDDGNGRLSINELERHQKALQAQVSTRLQLSSGNDPGTREFLQLSVELLETDPASAGGGTHLLVLVKQSFISAPRQLKISTDLFGTSGAEQQLAIKAMYDSTAEMAVPRARAPEYQFFKSAGHVAAQYTALGVEHILTGFDHVLFVLTILVAAAGWRYWLTILTSFTVAHSITLTLGMLNVVRISPTIVEPLILASIALMFALNITHNATRLSTRATIVFACGLLHGLGFASAMSDVGLSNTNKLISLLSFNAGIEIGQALIVAAALLAVSAAQRLFQLAPIASSAPNS